MLAALGSWIINFGVTMTDLLEILTRAGRDFFAIPHYGRRPTFRVYLKQVYFTGVEAFRIIAIISLIIGTVIITQIITLAGTGNELLIGKVMIWVVIRELGPLLTAIIVIARSGTAIATELGAMKLNGEIESIESLGIDSNQYLIMPRIFGVATAVVLLTIYFELISVLGGFIIATAGWHIPFDRFSEGVFATLTLKELGISMVKCLSFGLLLSAACCRQGLSVGKSATQIPQAATRGVMQSLFLIFIMDGFITLVSSFLH